MDEQALEQSWTEARYDSAVALPNTSSTFEAFIDQVSFSQATFAAR